VTEASEILADLDPLVAEAEEVVVVVDAAGQ
jgi:hypothetical protein